MSLHDDDGDGDDDDDDDDDATPYRFPDQPQSNRFDRSVADNKARQELFQHPVQVPVMKSCRCFPCFCLLLKAQTPGKTIRR